VTTSKEIGNLASKDWAFEVICLRSEAAERHTTMRGSRKASARGQSSTLESLLASRRAERVFDVQERGTSAVMPRALELPDFVSVGARDEREARQVLEQIKTDQPNATVYVAPPRHTLSRSSGAVTTAGAQRSFWGTKALGLPSSVIDASSMTVAVVDTGVDDEHPDLKPVIDDYVNFTRDPDKDQDGHGTHVCGIIAAAGGSPQGMRGVCNARLLVFKGLGKRYSARAYYRALRAACTRARIVNLSLGGTDLDPGEQTIINSALRQGVIVVAAMGNEFDNGNATNYPAALEGVVAVGAVDEQLAHAAFSNSGRHIALVAPGVGIWSTAPTYRSLTFPGMTSYAPCDGTSMAAPFVTGVVALLGASTPGEWDAKALREKIPVRRCPGQSRRTLKLGAGVLHWAGPFNLGSG
jgi:hypothetical protein